MSTVKFINEIKSSKSTCSARTILIASRSMLLNLSLVMQFLRNVFTNFIFKKLLSHETLVMGRATAISNNLCEQSNAAVSGNINERNCSTDVGSCDSFRSKFFANGVSCFRSFSLIEYGFANSFKWSSDRNGGVVGRERVGTAFPHLFHVLL